MRVRVYMKVRGILWTKEDMNSSNSYKFVARYDDNNNNNKKTFAKSRLGYFFFLFFLFDLIFFLV